MGHIAINNVNGNQPTSIKVGDHVRLRHSPDYLGKVIEDKIVHFLIVDDGKGNQYGVNYESLEIAPRLTPDGAWAELPYLVLAHINKRMTAWNANQLDTHDQSQIRHEAYKLLGGAGIKITEEVKERVRKAIGRLADAMGIELG